MSQVFGRISRERIYSFNLEEKPKQGGRAFRRQKGKSRVYQVQLISVSTIFVPSWGGQKEKNERRRMAAGDEVIKGPRKQVKEKIKG
jgi:hypothetical protein